MICSFVLLISTLSSALLNLGCGLFNVGDYKGACAAVEESVQIMKVWLAADHHDLGNGETEHKVPRCCHQSIAACNK